MVAAGAGRFMSEFMRSRRDGTSRSDSQSITGGSSLIRGQRAHPSFVTEFQPDVARRIHLRIVLFQQIINHVAKTGPGQP